MNHVDDVFSVTGQVRFNVARFINRKEGICSKSVRNVGQVAQFFSTTERTGRELGMGISGIRRKFGCNKLVTKVRRTPEGNNRQLLLKNVFAAVRGEQ